ncbi:hypothetical protein [Aeromonas veronii]|uniref:hypothetical protein n=1 Tax=Aeromonas veronii TaxID=654 RepID=UPI002B48D5F8|nr:hypothetical protein [Aeromonas veronii]
MFVLVWFTLCDDILAFGQKIWGYRLRNQITSNLLEEIKCTHISRPREVCMSLEEWLKIIGYISTGILIVVRIYVWMKKRERDKAIEQLESKLDALKAQKRLMSNKISWLFFLAHKKGYGNPLALNADNWIYRHYRER